MNKRCEPWFRFCRLWGNDVGLAKYRQSWLKLSPAGISWVSQATMRLNMFDLILGEGVAHGSRAAFTAAPGLQSITKPNIFRTVQGGHKGYQLTSSAVACSDNFVAHLTGIPE